MNRRLMLGIGFALLGAFAGAVLGERVVSSSLALLACIVGGGVVGWTAGVAAALRRERGDN